MVFRQEDGDSFHSQECSTTIGIQFSQSASVDSFRLWGVPPMRMLEINGGRAAAILHRFWSCLFLHGIIEEQSFFLRQTPFQSCIRHADPFSGIQGVLGANRSSDKAVEAAEFKVEKPAEKKMERAKGFEPSTLTLAT
jgi:hypothetical protein